ncbi:MAG TPA: WD40 repeat domain-containing protein, partial [Gemmataceae bacterium]|nr:WD40 repeat domain-containing protein [Gemmataceae bacterium]
MASLLGVVLGADPFLAKPARKEAAPASENKDKVDLYGDPLPAGAVLRLGTTRFRYGGFGIGGFRFLPDGKTLVVAPNGSHAVQFWEARTGKLVREISLGTLPVRAFAISPDGKYFAVAGFLADSPVRPWPEEIRIWETESGKEVRAFKRKDFDVDRCSLVFSPDNKLLMSIGRQGLLRIEEISSGVELLSHQFPQDAGHGIVLSPDGATLAVSTGANTGKLFVWKWKDGEEPREIKVRNRRGLSLAFSPDGTKLAGAAESGEIDQGVRVWEVDKGQLLHGLEAPASDHHTLRSVVFSPDGKTLAAVSYGNRHCAAIHLWDAASGRYRRCLEISDGSIAWLAFSPDSKLLAGASGNDFRVWDLAADKELGPDITAHRQPMSQILVAADGRIVTASEDGTIRIWDGETGKQRLKLTHEHWVRSIAVSPDGKKLVSSSLDDTVCLWDLTTGRKIYKLPGHGNLGGRRAVGFSTDGKSFLSWGDDMYLRKWDVATGKAVSEYKIRPKGVRVPEDEEDRDRMEFLGMREGALTPDCKLFILNGAGQNHVFEATTGNELQTFPTEGSHFTALAMSADSKLMLISEYAKQIQVKQPDGSVLDTYPPNHRVTLYE